MRCAIYCRLSREDEEKLSESESIQNQKSMLVQYAVEQKWDIYHIYCDEDYSGADKNRPDFNNMIRDAKMRCFDLILCKTQSRFTRDMELVERYLHSLFPLWGIRFIAIADHIDTSLQGNKKARQINGLVNEWYLEDLSENIRMVLDHKRKQGLYIGGFPLYGYQKHPTEKGRLIIDPTAATVVQKIFSRALEGHGKQQIAHWLNQNGVPNPSRYKQEHGLGYVNGSMMDPRGLWSRTSVGRILCNEMYLGTMVQGTHRKLSYKSHKLLTVPREQWFLVEGTHEAI
ncbi:MAG: resolvase, partial [Evtepia sp.]|nr:resolvase [Evtepia sp.]